MSNIKIHKFERAYGLIVSLYPESYRNEFGDEMKYVFSQSLKDTYMKNGNKGVMSLWISTLIDACRSLTTQYLVNNKLGKAMKPNKSDIIMQNTIFAWIALATVAVLLVPLIAMQFTSEVNWTLSDFVAMGFLMFGIGSLFVLAARKIHKSTNRIAVGIIFGLGLLYIWAELSVGIFTSIGS